MSILQRAWIFADGKKTYAVAIVTILYAVVVIGFGQGDWNTAIPMIFGGTGLGALRNSVGKAI